MNKVYTQLQYTLGLVNIIDNVSNKYGIKYSDFLLEYRDKNILYEINKLDKDSKFEEKYKALQNKLISLFGPQYLESNKGLDILNEYRYKYLYNLLS